LDGDSIGLSGKTAPRPVVICVSFALHGDSLAVLTLQLLYIAQEYLFAFMVA